MMFAVGCPLPVAQFSISFVHSDAGINKCNENEWIIPLILCVNDRQLCCANDLIWYVKIIGLGWMPSIVSNLEMENHMRFLYCPRNKTILQESVKWLHAKFDCIHSTIAMQCEMERERNLEKPINRFVSSLLK